ncbi:hypothetical protein SO3561_07199 [Streptomyces olivochromogenes]|uniref:Uncharacterized protein n=1 Tax=Streptomyces olivochromogenes TaxID=1963 RepID=A0A250VN46_STROL|nr:hypothetical protein SO3561_07199 [Streptomyces olivochromogenes]
MSPALTTYIGAVFNNGFVARLLDLSLRANTSEDEDFENEIARLCRSMRSTGSASWALPLATAAATVDLVAEVLASSLRTRLPAGFEERLALAADGGSVEEYLSDTASAIRKLDSEVVPGYGELPMAPWEVSLAFPQVIDFKYWVETDEFETLDECLWAGFDSMHPGECASSATALVAQAQEALILFPDPDVLRSTLSQSIPWVSRNVLLEIVRKGNEHLAELHGFPGR